MVTRIAPSRKILPRGTPTKNGVSPRMKPNGVTLVDKSREKQYLSSLKLSVNNTIGSITNLNNLTTEARTLYNKALANIPAQYHQTIKTYINQASANLRTEQTALASRLSKSVAYYKKQESYFSSIGNSATADKYDTQRIVASKMLSSLNSGNVLDDKATYETIYSKGRITQREKAFRISQTNLRRAGELQTTKLTQSVNTYLEQTAETNTVNTIAEIKKKFGVSESVASSIRKMQTKNITSGSILTPSTKYLISEVNKDFTFYDRFVKTNASFPDNIQNARKIFLGELGAKQHKSFLSLSSTNQQTILNYSILKSLAHILPKQTRQREPKDIQKILKIQGVDISVTDAKLLSEIGMAKSSDLLKIARVKDVNKYIHAYNKSLSKEKALPLARSESLMLKIRKEFNDIVNSTKQKSLKQYLIAILIKPLFTKTSTSELMDNILLDPIRKITTPEQLLNKIILKAKWVSLRNKISKGEGLTQKEYVSWTNGLKDLTGIKTAVKKATKGTQQNFKKLMDTIILDISGKRKRTVASYPKEIQQVRSLFYNELTPKEKKHFDKKAFQLALGGVISAGKIAKRSLIIAGNDWWTLGKAILKIPPKVVKFAYRDGVKLGERFGHYLLGYRRTPAGKKDVLEITKLLRKVAKGANWVKENPELVSLGLAMGIISLNTSQKKLLKENPREWVAQVGSFFADDLAIKGIGKVAKIGKLIKIKLSPFVLRNIDVFSEGASLHVSAQALSSLEGKTINLFSSTPEGLFDLFKKSTPITRKDASVLIKDMLKNPMNYIGENLKIKSLSSIVNSKPKAEILNFMKIHPEGILTGSGGLSLQLGKWRKVGDLDIIVKNAQKYAYNLLDHLNNKNFLGKILNKPRFKVKKLSNLDVYRIYDAGIGGRLKYNAKRVIVDIDGIVGYEQQFLKTGKLTKNDIRKIGGVNVLKVEAVLPRKTELTLQATKSRRYEKELNDLKLITSKLNKKINNKEYEAVKRLLDSEKGLLKVRGFADNLSAKRKWGWAEKLLGDLKLRFIRSAKKDKEVISRLKKIGFTEKDINKAINTLSANDMYFSPNVIYSYYLTPKGKLKRSAGIIIMKDVTISSYPKHLQKLMKDNVIGLLSKKQQSGLANELRKWRTKNPDKFFIGQEAVKDRVGELEVLLSEYSKLYAKKYFITREVYIPALDKFVKVQEVMLKKPTQKTIKSLYATFQTKFKKGYSVSDIKKDISNWMKKHSDLIKESKLKSEEIKKSQDIFLKKETLKLDNKIDDIKKLNLPETKKRELLNSLRRERKFLTPSNLNKHSRKILLIRTSRLIKRIVKTISRIKPIKRVLVKRKLTKRVVRKRIAKQPTRVIKRKVIKRKLVARKPIRRKLITRKPIKRVIGLKRPIKRIPDIKRPIDRVKPLDPIKKKLKLPHIRFKLNWDKKPPKGYSRIVNVLVRVRGINKELKWKTTPNRALKQITKLVDNTTSRSFKLKIIGIKKVKDIKKFNLSKFRAKKSKNSPVLSVVEKVRHAIDTRGEKQGLTLARALKKRKNMMPNSKKKVVKRGIIRRSNNKRNVQIKKNKKKKTIKRKKKKVSKKTKVKRKK